MLNRSLNRTRPRSFSLFLSIASFRQQMSTTPTIIQVIYDPEEKHRRHEPMTEFVLGHQMPHYHERPVRHENVLQHLREGMNQQSPGGLFKFIPSDKDYGFQPLLRIHSSGYLEYLQHVHSDWVRNEGNKDSGVMGDTFPVVRRPLYSTPVIDWPSNGRGDEGEDDLLSALIRRSLSAVSWGWSWWRWLRFGDLQLHRTSTAKLGLISQGGNPGYFSSDIDAPLMEGTWEAAYIASQLALRAADSLASEINSTSAKSNICATFAVCRPPGHHAHSELSGGFCYLNNAAIAAQYLIDNYKMRVLILDVDNHHGNGTQQIFYRVPNPRFISLHAKPDYPWFTGDVEERGQGSGLGYTINVPLQPGTKSAEYLQHLRRVLEENSVLPAPLTQPSLAQRLLNKLWRPYSGRPDVLIVSLGVDPYVDDPVGKLEITQKGFREIGRLIGEAKIPVVFVLEGGYDVENIGENVGNVLQGFHERYNS